jgi:anti-sigma regulatory factor (Ser/Thr protein kinase)
MILSAETERKACSVIDYADGFPTVTINCNESSDLTYMTDVLMELTDEHDSCISLDLTCSTDLQHVVLESLTSVANLLGERNRKLHLKKSCDSVCEMLDRLLLSEAFCTGTNRSLSSCSPTCNHACKRWQMDFFSLTPDFSNGRLARRRVDKLAQQMGYSAEFRSEVQIAVGEAFANAAEYGCKEPGNIILISCLGTPDKLCITVTDSGSGFELEDIPECSVDNYCEHGRGILCIEALMDDVDYDFNYGTTLRMVKHSSSLLSSQN